MRMNDNTILTDCAEAELQYLKGDLSKCPSRSYVVAASGPSTPEVRSGGPARARGSQLPAEAPIGEDHFD